MKKMMSLALVFSSAMIGSTVFADNIDTNVNQPSSVKKIKVKAPPAKMARTKVEEPEKVTETTAEEESPLTGYLALVTDYIFRGITNSNNLPALQGSVTYTFLTTGIYLNLWSSSIDQTAVDDSRGTIEIDTGIGITNDINDDWNYNLSLIRYNYPKAHSLDYNEAIGTLTWKILTATIGYSDNVYNVKKPGTYYNLAVKFNVPCEYVYFNDVSFGAGIGHYDLPTEAGPSYNDYALLVEKKISNWVLALQWTDTNHRYSNDSADHKHIFASATANF